MPIVTLLRHATLERCGLNSHAGAWELVVFFVVPTLWRFILSFPCYSAHLYTQVLVGDWEHAPTMEVRLCLTSIVGAFPIPASLAM